ncbi:AAA family ATPase [Cupriavidus necator]|uniref:AAA family ATPase n=1 Tax=Cupriavidus necator TaxID=106590 RepID=UPI0027850141|nr:AAA family ATPase [Cupriavidus necator]MDQ0138958.1 energy-coupling factor transporter ATP-binding protein EcfA2 [Cupriavidus necator]
MDASSKKPSRSFSLLFGTRQALHEARLESNTILIVPSDNDWNDFGYRIRVDIRARIVTEPGVETQVEGMTSFLGFVTDSDGVPNGVALIEKLLHDAKTQTVPVNKTPQFFTMLPDMESYRELERNLGSQRIVDLLLALNDVVTSAEFAPATKWLSRATATEVFQQAFLRNSDSFFAYKNAGSVLRGREFEVFGNLSRAVHISFQLAGRENPHDLTFRFEHEALLPKRIAVVIGKNGVGKSQTLGRIAKAALHGRRELSDGDTSGRLVVNRILAFAPTNEARSVFPSGNVKRPRVWYRRFSLNRSGSSRSSDSIAEQILQLARSAEALGTSSRWDIFLNAIRAIDNWEQLALIRRHKGSSPLPLHSLILTNEQSVLRRLGSIDPSKEPVRTIDDMVYPLSSGEISFLRFAAQASLHIENGSLLLLDEPETHLHPNFISQFAALLDKLLAQSGSAAIIATHSAYFVREVFQDQVVVLRSDKEGFVQSEQPKLRTFGADVGAISYFVFGEDEASKMACALEARLKKGFDSWEKLYEAYKDQLSLEMLGSLRQAMERPS